MQGFYSFLVIFFLGFDRSFFLFLIFNSYSYSFILCHHYDKRLTKLILLIFHVSEINQSLNEPTSLSLQISPLNGEKHSAKLIIPP